jgi:hypothetical protein
MGFMSAFLCSSVIVYLVQVWAILWLVYVYVFQNKIFEINEGQLKV